MHPTAGLRNTLLCGLVGLALGVGPSVTARGSGATGTRVFGINPQGDVVGSYTEAGGRGMAQSFDFETIDVPCSSCPNGIARRTALGGINPRGDIVGVYTDAVGRQHGFL